MPHWAIIRVVCPLYVFSIGDLMCCVYPTSPICNLCPTVCSLHWGTFHCVCDPSPWLPWLGKKRLHAQPVTLCSLYVLTSCIWKLTVLWLLEISIPIIQASASGEGGALKLCVVSSKHDVLIWWLNGGWENIYLHQGIPLTWKLCAVFYYYYDVLEMTVICIIRLATQAVEESNMWAWPWAYLVTSEHYSQGGLPVVWEGKRQGRRTSDVTNYWPNASTTYSFMLPSPSIATGGICLGGNSIHSVCVFFFRW